MSTTAAAGVSLDLRVQDAEVRAALDSLARKARHLSPVMRAIGESQVTEVRMRFERAKDPQGKPWKTLSEATIARHPAGTSAKIGRRTGNLYRSYVYKAGDDDVRIGSNREYARIFELGGEAGRKSARVTIPARPALGLSEEGKRDLIETVTEYLRDVD